MVAAIDCGLPRLVLAAVVACAAHACDAQQLTGAAGVATDYVFRGLTAGGGKPALIVDAQWLGTGGWSVGAGAVRAGDFREITVSAAQSWQLDPDSTLQAGAVFYGHPDGAERQVPDYTEAWLAAGWRGRVHATLALSPDTAAFGRDGQRRRGRAAVAELTLHQPLGAGFSADAGVGWWELRAAGRGYPFGSAGVSWSRQPVLLSLSWVTSRAADFGIGESGRNGSRVLATLLLRY